MHSNASAKANEWQLEYNKFSCSLNMASKFFIELEKKLKEKIPTDIVQIFLECGFDSELSFFSVAPETIIIDIEQYANEDLSILKNTSYEGAKYFKFKPGHKSFILNFPNRLKEAKCEGEQYKISDFSCILKIVALWPGLNLKTKLFRKQFS